MRAWVLVVAVVLAVGCGGSNVAGPPTRTPCIVVCIEEMHSDFAATCPKGSAAELCAERDAIIGRFRDCADRCP